MPAWYAEPLEMKEWTESEVRIQYACRHQCRKAPIERPLPLPTQPLSITTLAAAFFFLVYFLSRHAFYHPPNDCTHTQGFFIYLKETFIFPLEIWLLRKCYCLDLDSNCCKNVFLPYHLTKIALSWSSCAATVLSHMLQMTVDAPHFL
jgi:hypothetical protein